MNYADDGYDYQQTHDQLIQAMRQADENEATPMAMFGDHLQEHGQPGGIIATEAAKYHPNGFARLWNKEDIQSLSGNVDYIPRQNDNEPHRGGLDYIESVRRVNPRIEPKTPVYLKALHQQYSGPFQGGEFRVPVLSHRHLNYLISDLPEHMQTQLRDSVVNAGLPEDHEEQYAQYDDHTDYDDDSFNFPSFTDMRLPPPTIPGSVAPGSQQSIEAFGSPWVQGSQFPREASRPQMSARYARTDYSHEAFQGRAEQVPHDSDNRKIYADWLEDHDPHSVSPETLHFLRNHEGPAWVQHHPHTGQVVAGPRLTWSDIQEANGGRFRFVPNLSEDGEFHGRGGEFFGVFDGSHESPHGTPHSGPGGHYFVTNLLGGIPPNDFSSNVWRFNPDTGGVSILADRLTGDRAHQNAHQLSQTVPEAPQSHQDVDPDQSAPETPNYSNYAQSLNLEHPGAFYEDMDGSDYSQTNYGTQEDLFRQVAANHDDHQTHSIIADWLDDYHPHLNQFTDWLRHQSGAHGTPPTEGYFGPMSRGPVVGETGPFRVHAYHPLRTEDERFDRVLTTDPNVEDPHYWHNPDEVVMHFHPRTGEAEHWAYPGESGLQNTNPLFGGMGRPPHATDAWAAWGGYAKPVGYTVRMPTEHAQQFLQSMGLGQEEQPPTNGPDEQLSRYADDDSSDDDEDDDYSPEDRQRMQDAQDEVDKDRQWHKDNASRDQQRLDEQRKRRTPPPGANYARVDYMDPDEFVANHDALIRSIQQTDENEGTGLGMLGDLLQENGQPGGLLATEGAKWRPHGFMGAIREPISTVRGENGHHGIFVANTGKDRTDFDYPGLAALEVVQRDQPQLQPHTNTYIKALHNEHNGSNFIEYRIPVLSHRHLNSMLADVPSHVLDEVRNRVLSVDPQLPEDHEEMQQMSQYAGELVPTTQQLPDVPLPPGIDPRGSLPHVLDAIHHWHARMKLAYDDLASHFDQQGKTYHANVAQTLSDEHRLFKIKTRQAMHMAGVPWPMWAEENPTPVPTEDDYGLAEDMIHHATVRPPKQRPQQIEGHPPDEQLSRYDDSSSEDESDTPQHPDRDYWRNKTPYANAKYPEPEQGILTPEQHAIAQQAFENGDYTATAVLGDHLAESGYPNAGALLSRVGVGYNNTPHNYHITYFSGPEYTTRWPEGRFEYRMIRDGSDLVHLLHLKSDDEGPAHTVMHRVRPQEQANMSRYSRTDYDFGDTDVTESYAEHRGTHYMDPSHADFHAAIHANPDEAMGGLTYADWLEEHGMPAHAHVIRSHVGEMQKVNEGVVPGGDDFDISGTGGIPGQLVNPHPSQFTVDTSRYGDGLFRIRLQSPQSEHPVWWSFNHKNPQEADQLVNQLWQEGAVTHPHSWHQPDDEDEGIEPVQEHPMQLARYAGHRMPTHFGFTPPKKIPSGFESREDFDSHVASLFRFGMTGPQIAKHLGVPLTRVWPAGDTVPVHERPGHAPVSKDSYPFRELNHTRPEYIVPFDINDLGGHVPRQVAGEIDKEDQFDRFKKMREEGHTQQEIADSEGVTHATALRRLHGIRQSGGGYFGVNDLRRMIHDQEGVPILPIQSQSSQLSRYADYAAEPNHSDFHTEMEINGERSTTPAAKYSTWLMRQGQPATAAIMRSHIFESGGGYRRRPYAPDYDGDLQPGQFHASVAQHGSDAGLTLHQRSTIDPKSVYYWQVMTSPESAGEYADLLHQEGVPVREDSSFNTTHGIPPMDRDSGAFPPPEPHEDFLPPQEPESNTYPSEHDEWREDEGPDYFTPASRYERTDYGLEDEDSFHAHLDAHPDDHTARMIFADYLDEQNDPRAAGYRALGVNGRRPDFVRDHTRSSFFTSPRAIQYYGSGDFHHPDSVLPIDWYETIPVHTEAQGGGEPSHWKYHPNRRAVEDAAAHAFSQLPPERQHELLNPQQPEQLSRYAQTNYMEPTHEDFLNKIHENISEHTPQLVYADWLEENGQPAHAAFIRRAVERQKDEYNTGAFQTGAPAWADTPFGTAGFDGTYGSHIDLSSQIPNEQGYRIVWTLGPLGEADHRQLHKGLVGEGATAGRGYTPPDDSALQPDEQASRYADSAWSDAGGTMHRDYVHYGHVPEVIEDAIEWREDMNHDEGLYYADDDNQAWTDPHAPFHQAIYPELGGNPLDPMGHYAYSDFLREQGNEDEADFRKAMGDWVGGGNSLVEPSHELFPYRISLHNGHERYPNGVHQEYMSPATSDVTGQEVDFDSERPRLFAGSLNWRNYPLMETAFRRAFHQNRRDPTLHQLTEQQSPGANQAFDQLAGGD